MKTTLRRMILLCLALLASIVLVPATQAAPSTCTATIRIFGTGFGTIVKRGNIVYYDDFPVAGVYESDVLAGYTLTGTQDVRENVVTGRATVQGTYVATGPAGTLTTRYAVTIDSSGQVTGAFTATNGTGDLADAHWAGVIRGQRVGRDKQGLPTYLATLSGPCRNLA